MFMKYDDIKDFYSKLPITYNWHTEYTMKMEKLNATVNCEDIKKSYVEDINTFILVLMLKLPGHQKIHNLTLKILDTTYKQDLYLLLDIFESITRIAKIIKRLREKWNQNTQKK